MTKGAKINQRARKTSGFTYWLGRTFLKNRGWTLEGAPPDADQFVLIAAPHTTNWDLVYLLACAYAHGLHLNWIGKAELFWFPLGALLRWLGGVPVDRSKSNGVVGQMAEVFRKGENVVLTIPPEGTRSLSEGWKSGFYYIALEAGVPIVPGFLDYKKKVGGLGPAFMPSGDIDADMEKLRIFYEPIQGLYPENFSPVKVRPSERSKKAS